MRVPGALAIEKCFARKTGLRYHVDLHLEVDPNMTVVDSHEIAHRVKLAVMDHLPWVEDVLIHVEPHLSPLELSARTDLRLTQKQ
jgi:divalent metal cation (Fe/Co/Zn/Cd) transporter